MLPGRLNRAVLSVLVLGASSYGAACKTSTPADSGLSSSEDGGTGGAGDASTSIDVGQSTGPDAGRRLSARLVADRFFVAEHMRASIEMQLSGEPFAQVLGYNLNNFTRSSSVTDQYIDPATTFTKNDPLGYALAIESYEYSKQPMNNLSFESGAGLSLMFGPVLNASTAQGREAYRLLLDRFQKLAVESNVGRGSSFTSPPPRNNPLNWYGWPGLWPVFAEFSSFDPTIDPMPGPVPLCYLAGAFGYDATGRTHNALVANYECDYNSLHLVDREAQVTKRLEPDALGYVAWKQGLWLINYWQSFHDIVGNGITTVTSTSLMLVGVPGNRVVGRYPDPTDPTGMRLLTGRPGTYLGDVPIEGWQGLLMMEEIDNKAGLILGSLATSDGIALRSAGTYRQAIDYGYDAPLLYFPAAIDVDEVVTATAAVLEGKYFPRPSAFRIADPTSKLKGLSGLIGGFGEAFAFTDANNGQVGGSQQFLATFDGDPFPADDGLPDGENTLHDRALAILKIALVDLDRLHFDPGAKVLVDTATISGGAVQRGARVSTVELAEAILALRNAYRSLNGSLQLYSNDTPDTLGMPSALDAAPLGRAPYAGTLAAHMVDLIRAEADFLSQSLIDADGAVSNAYDLAAKQADPGPTVLEAEAGAIRGLLEAYLATSDERYRMRARDVYADLERRFWMENVRLFRTTAGIDAVTRYTPLRFGLLEGALRQYFKLVASSPGREDEARRLLFRVKRTMKLILNGWDDQNQDDRIQYPGECLGARLEFGERSLTGEIGHAEDNGDRDHDCIKEISTVHLPAALGAELEIAR